MATTPQNDIFSSVISDIKTYNGNDPLLPWIRGVRKMRESLLPQILKEKLPRFLQKCAQTFESDKRYRNDVRFIRIWLQLMDYVDEPKALLQSMETNRIGVQRSLFYQAYALYYEKMKKFEEAEKMYRLGVQNLAEPLDDLQKSYEQFLYRMERHKNKRIQRRPLAERTMPKVEPGTLSSIESQKVPVRQTKCPMTVENLCNHGTSTDVSTNKQTDEMSIRDHIREVKHLQTKSIAHSMLQREDTVVIKRFVNTAIVGKSEAEDACHHGLVEPTINMKEAMNVINDMFREPLEPALVTRKSRNSQSQHKETHYSNCNFEVFVDEDMDGRMQHCRQKEGKGFQAPEISKAKAAEMSIQEPLHIFVDDDEECKEVEDKSSKKKDSEEPTESHSPSLSSHMDAFSFLRPVDNNSGSSNEANMHKLSKPKFREDTVVCRFVGSTILDEPKVENICHHGLVDPTVNLREAMDDINDMFGKPIDFVRTTRRKRLENAASSTSQDYGGFSILPDDDLVPLHNQKLPSSSRNEKDGFALFEPTAHTKEAIDDINKMFAMPLDF